MKYVEDKEADNQIHKILLLAARGLSDSEICEKFSGNVKNLSTGSLEWSEDQILKIREAFILSEASSRDTNALYNKFDKLIIGATEKVKSGAADLINKDLENLENMKNANASNNDSRDEGNIQTSLDEFIPGSFKKCSKCGNLISEDSITCIYCGLSSSIRGYELDISDSRKNYISLRLKYKSYSEIIGNDFLARYDNLFSKIGTFDQSLDRISYEYLRKVTDAAVRDIVKYNIFDIDDVAFIELYGKLHLSFKNDVQSVTDEYLQTVLSKQQYQEYIAERSRNSSGGFIGGGIGVEGAAVGIGIATAANLAIGMLSGISNAIDKGLNSVATNRQLVELISGDETKHQLYQAVKNIGFNAHYCIVEIINGRYEDTFDQVNTADELRSAAITNNIHLNRIPHDVVETCILEAFHLSPFNACLYELWKNVNPSANIEIGQLATILDVYSTEMIDEKEGASNPQMANTKTSFKDNLLEIITLTESKDFYVGGQIPLEKIENAKNFYFYDPADVALALIDCTVFGSAENGMVIGLEGIYWKNEGEDAKFISWRNLKASRSTVSKSFTGVNIGDGNFSLNGSGMSRESVARLLVNLCESSYIH